MTPLTNAHTLSQAQHAVRWLAVLLLLVAAGFVALVVRGTFDPRPCGSAALVDSAQLGSLALAGRGETFEQQPFPFAGTPSCYAVRLTAAHITGEMDSGYGLAIGDRNAALVVAVSPLGESAVWQTIADEGEPRYLLPWQPWPHVNAGTTPNEIWLEVDDNAGITQVTARVNRELLWQGDVALPDTGVAPWLGSFGGPVTVDFQTLDWFLPPPT